MNTTTTPFSSLKASIILIGNELLSGRTTDCNLSWIAKQLGSIGIAVRECRIIRDDFQEIKQALGDLCPKSDFVFTTGGIGPTHDDITSEAVARALSLPFICHPVAKNILENHYKENINEARLSMAYMPEGASLILNPLTAAPGFYINNIYVLPGVPSIMQAMFGNLLTILPKQDSILSKEYHVFLPEGEIAKAITELQEAHPEMDCGSYPFIQNDKWITCIVLKSGNHKALDSAGQSLEAMLKEKSWEYQAPTSGR